MKSRFSWRCLCGIAIERLKRIVLLTVSIQVLMTGIRQFIALQAGHGNLLHRAR